MAKPVKAPIRPPVKTRVVQGRRRRVVSVDPMPAWSIIYTAMGILAIDYFILGQGLLSVLIAMGVIFRMPVLFTEKFAATRVHRVRNSVIMIIAGCLGVVLTFQIQNNAFVEAERVIAAVYGYRDYHGRYPSELNELEPQFIASVPRARPSLMAGRFTFFSSKGQAILTYFTYPPFIRRSFSFAENRWVELNR